MKTVNQMTIYLTKIARCVGVHFFLLFIYTVNTANAQVEVHINSGNPVYPFPQFLPYANESGTLNNLATQPGDGVTHAEMEQTIRDAYQIMMNRAEKPGGGVDGVDYIYFQSTPSCTEGDGYALLAAAAMADKETFDGLWLWIHDFRMNKVKRYSDCEDSSPEYAYSQLPGWTGSGANSAADGDFDIGLALLVAYLQWGEFMGIDDACGEPISYKKEAVEFMKALTDTIPYNVNDNYVTGDIGLDGYFKGGDSWTELTGWANDVATSGFSILPEHKGPSQQHIDYTAPSYFKAFADFLAQEDSARYAWNIYQFRRAEASSDWLMGQVLNDEKMIPFAGWVELDENNNATFSNFSDGEDFRMAWRTILNSMWHGDPNYTWDPETHQVQPGIPNSFESDVGKRYARFLWDSRQQPWNFSCVAGVSDTLASFWGPDILKYYYTPEGEPLGTFALNWVPGTGSPSAVVAQDFDLMAQLYRNLEIKWDGTEGGRYITSVPHYFHGWFRLLGMLVLTGNYQRPAEIKPTANMKVYLDIDKSFAFERDTITYHIDYRNYGSLDAQGVTIKDTLHPDFVYISSTGGGVYDAATNVVTWDIGTVPGFKTTTGVEPTTGRVSLHVMVGTATENQYRNSVTISCTNGSGWTSNEFPNDISSVMRRNHLDIAKRALVVDKKASNTHVNPGSEIEFTIDFENTSEAGWINGGRTGVHFAYSHDPLPSGSAAMTSMRVKLFHDADEAYIDYGNYRISYFLFDAGLKCYAGEEGCSNGWQVQPTIVEGVDPDFITILHENITPGEDDYGKWNQRIILQFSDPTNPERTINLTTTNYHINWYRGIEGMIHRGGTDPLRLVWNVNTSTWTEANWSDDWSWDPAAEDTDDGKYWPVTADWTDPDNPNVAVTTWNPKECATASHTVDNVLVEEWDGYTWRRVAGNGPLPGREVTNVIIRDTIPDGFSFSRFTGKPPFGIEPTVEGNVITWSIPKLQVNQKASLTYVATASGACPMQDKAILTRAWISADRESPIADSVAVTVTCDSVPPPPLPPTTMYKQADRMVYGVDDTVTYSIAYKQTHGSIVTDASDIGEWLDHGGNGLFTISQDTIVYDQKDGMMVHSYSYGVNGTFGGTIFPPTYSSFSLVARSSEDDFVEIRMFRDYGDMRVQFYNSGTQVGEDQRFSYTDFNSTPPNFNFKVKLAGDTISLWAGDTTEPSPNVTQTGIDIRAGYAGVRNVEDFSEAKLWNWNSHFDAAYDVTIHDPLPSNLTFTSAGGTIVTGPLAGKELTANYNGGDITWPVVGGDEVLEAGDSVSLWLKATVGECYRDTISNTAYTNIRGYPTDYIGAHTNILCLSEDDGRPYHIDIILDTINFDRTTDEILDSLTLGPNQDSFTLYAIVRDRNGRFIRYANASWSSSDITVATVKANRWTATINNVGSGASVISAHEPDILGDSLFLTIDTAPSWPSIKSAVMLDDNGDLSPDMLSVVLQSDFAENQKLDSVVIQYNGNKYVVPASSVIQQDLFLSIPFTTLSGKDSRPTGNVTIHMSGDDEQKQNSRSFVDGVGPALTAASVIENLGNESNVLVLTFSESIVTSTLNGNQLLLINGSLSDPIPLFIESIIDSLGENLFIVNVSSESDLPQAGDSLRLVPKGQNGLISDLNANLPHDLNPSVVLTLKKGPAAISSAAYFDGNADGFVDYATVRFKRSVDRSEFASVKILWNFNSKSKGETLTKDHIDFINDSTIKVPVGGALINPENRLTNPNMDIRISYSGFTDYPITSPVADSAAPVALSARVYPGAYLENDSRQPDTLKVLLSEPILLSFGSKPFSLSPKDGSPDLAPDMHLTGLSQTTYHFTIPNSNLDESLLFTNGDSLYINPDAEMADTRGKIQDNPLNNRVPVKVVWPPATWRKSAGPNPFSPSTKGESIMIKLKPTTPVDLRNVQITCTIFDAIGNVLFSETLQLRDNAFLGIWDGRNQNGRIVGEGTYSAFLVIEDGSGSETKLKIPLGITN